MVILHINMYTAYDSIVIFTETCLHGQYLKPVLQLFSKFNIFPSLHSNVVFTLDTSVKKLTLLQIQKVKINDTISQGCRQFLTEERSLGM